MKIKMPPLLRRLLKSRTTWLAAVFLFFFGAGIALGSWRNLCADCPSIARIFTWEPEQTSKLFSHDGTLITELGFERRTPVSIHALPDHVRNAFIAVEDKRFHRHKGYDVRGITRAAFNALVHRGFSRGGGSTITQQLARNMFQDKIGYEKRIQRKLKELQVALDLERVYTKEEILEAYVNQINYAHGWWGIQTAARNYFGKNATEINPAEAALLAAVVNRPSYYSPFRHPDNALQRRNLVLSLMADQGYLSQEEAEKWKSHPLPAERAEGGHGLAPYFEEWVRQMLDDRFGSEVYTGGLRVYTTLDAEMQRIAQASMEEGWKTIEEKETFAHAKYEEFAEEEEAFPAGKTPYLQGAFIALDPETGAVRAMIGGRDFAQSKFNRAVQAERQAGSAFKPFVYAAAINSRIPGSHIILDAPVVRPQVSGEEWKPRNFTRDFQGPVTIREGLYKSINMIAIQLAEEVGLESVAQMARRLGIRTRIERFPSTAIGAPDVIPLQMAEAYSAFATLGTKVRPHPIVRVENAEGEVLWVPQPERTQVLDSLPARIVVDMLEDIVRRGTAYTAVRVRGNLPHEVPAAGKTGTTNGGSDVWFVGFTPNLLAAVWFGMDEPTPIRISPGREGVATGGGDAAPVWGKFMRRVYFGDDSTSGAHPSGAEGLQDSGRTGGILPIPGPWPILAGLRIRQVDRKTGLLASPWCPDSLAYRELYLPGTEPTEPCDRMERGIFDLPDFAALRRTRPPGPGERREADER